MNKFLPRLSTIAIAINVLMLSACGGGGGPDNAPPPPVEQVPSVPGAPSVPGDNSPTTPVPSVPNNPTNPPPTGSTDPVIPAPYNPPAPPTPNDALITDKIFAANSFWYTPIPVNAPLHPNSNNFVGEFLRQRATYYGNVTINTNAYSSPVYIADASTPTVNVQFNDCQNKGYADAGLMNQWTNVPIPSHAAPADGTDSEMTIYQPSTNTLYEFWVTDKVNGVWRACWGGRMQNVSTDDGIWNFPYGTTATGLPFIGGQITAEELLRGEIRHAIGISLVDLANWDVVSWPANRSDGSNPGNAPHRIAEGQRFRLNPNINVDALNIHPVAKTIAKAAQKYGFVVWDKAGALSLRVQNPKSYTWNGSANPYDTLFNGTPNYQILDGFPWDQLQFLPMDYGKP